MASDNSIWLLTNARSGSNSAQAIGLIEEQCDRHGFCVERKICFPDEDLPTAADLDRAGITRLAIFTGDGTLNAALTSLYGWGGAIAVLPGGTMNLLSKRLHGVDASIEEIIARMASGAAKRVRPQITRCAPGDALAGLLVGPGTSWAGVRESMRDFDIAGIAEGTSEAIADITGESMVRCVEPDRGRNDGYPLIELSPGHRGMHVDAFHAEGTGEVLSQSLALLKRNFREGPHTRLGLLDEMTLETVDGSPLPILIDGEPAEVGPRAQFTMASCEVDLLATHHGY